MGDTKSDATDLIDLEDVTSLLPSNYAKFLDQHLLNSCCRSRDLPTIQSILHSRIHLYSAIQSAGCAHELDNLLENIGNDFFVDRSEKFATWGHLAPEINNLSLRSGEPLLLGKDYKERLSRMDENQRIIFRAWLELTPPRNRHPEDQRNHYAEVMQQYFDLLSEDDLYTENGLKRALEAIVRMETYYDQPSDGMLINDIHDVLKQVVERRHIAAKASEIFSQFINFETRAIICNGKEIEMVNVCQLTDDNLLFIAKGLYEGVLAWSECKDKLSPQVAKRFKFPKKIEELLELGDPNGNESKLSNQDDTLMSARDDLIKLILRFARKLFFETEKLDPRDIFMATTLPSCYWQGKASCLYCCEGIVVVNTMNICAVADVVQVVEIGIDLDKTYKIENSDKLTLKIDANGLPLRQLLDGFEALLIPMSGTMLEVNLRDKTSEYDLSNSMSLIRSDFGESFKTKEGVVKFLRYALFVQNESSLSLEARKVVEKLSITYTDNGKKHSDQFIPADSLTALLNYLNFTSNSNYLSEMLTMEEFGQQFPCSYSILLYCTRISLFSGLSDNLKRDSENHWKKVTTEPDGKQNSTQKRIYDLICCDNVEHIVEIMDAAEFDDARTIVKRTMLPNCFFSVELTNFDHLLELVDTQNQSLSLQFVFAVISDNVAVADIISIATTCLTGSVRLVIHRTAHTTMSLQGMITKGEVGCMTSSGEFSDRISDYGSKTVVGNCINECSRNSNLTTIVRSSSCPFPIVFDNSIRQYLKDLTPLKTYILLTGDYDYIRRFLENEKITWMSIHEAIDKNGIHKMMEVLTCHNASNSTDEHVHSKTLVILRSELLSDKYKINLAKRCQKSNICLLLITNCVLNEIYSSDISIAKFEVGPNLAKEYLLRSVDYRFSVYRFLRMVFGSQFPLSLLNEDFSCLASKLKSRLYKGNEVLLEEIIGIGEEILAKKFPISETPIQCSRTPNEIVHMKTITKICHRIADLIGEQEFNQDVPFDVLVRDNAFLQLCDQKRRIELWLKYINMSKDIILNTGHNVHSTCMLDYFLCDATENPSYHNIDKRDSHSQLSIERKVKSGDCLDWSSAQLGKNLSSLNCDRILAILTIYPYRLKILFSIDAKGLFELFNRDLGELYAPILQAICDDIISLESSNCALHCACDHVAVLKWSILMNTFSAEHYRKLTITQNDINCLVRMKLPIGASKSNYDFLKSIPLYCSLDAPDNYISNQAELREYLQTCDVADIGSMLFTSQTAIGAVFVDFLLQTCHSDNKEGVYGLNFTKSLKNACFNKSAADDPVQADDAKNFKHLSACAWSHMIMRATSEEAIKRIYKLMTASEVFNSNLFFNKILTELDQNCANAASNSNTFSFIFLCQPVITSRMESKEPDNDLQFGNSLFGSICAALCKDDFSDCFQRIIDMRKNFPLETTPRILKHYVDYFSTPPSDLAEFVSIQRTLLGTQGFLVMFNELITAEDPPRWLLYLSWTMHPHKHLPFLDDPALLLDIVSIVGNAFIHTVVQNKDISSPLALFLVCNQYLEVSAYNYYCKKFEKDPINPFIYIIGQKGRPNYPPYFLTIFSRKLEAGELMRNLDMNEIRLLVNNFNSGVPNDMLAFDYQISGEVSKSIIQTNIVSLCKMMKLPARNDDNNNNATVRNSCRVILAWFQSFGVAIDVVKDIVKSVKPEFEGKLDETCNIFDSTKYVYRPFPSICAPFIQTESHCQIFVLTEKSAELTLQMFQALIPEGNRDLVVYHTADMLLIEKSYDEFGKFKIISCRPTEIFLNVMPKRYANAFGAFLAKKAKQLALIKPAMFGNRNNISVDYSSLQETLMPLVMLLMRLLRDYKNRHDERSRLINIVVRSFVEGLKNEYDNAPDKELLSAVTYRAIFSSIGISECLETQVLHSILIDCFLENHLNMCYCCLNELLFFIDTHPIAAVNKEFIDRYTTRVQGVEKDALELSINNIKLIKCDPGISLLHEVDEEQETKTQIQEDTDAINHPIELFSLQTSFSQITDSACTSDYSINHFSCQETAFATVDGSEIIEVVKCDGYVEIKIKAGSAITLLQKKPSETESLIKKLFYKFSSTELPQDNNNYVALCTFENHSSAWKYCKQLPSGSSIVANGIILSILDDGLIKPWFNTIGSFQCPFDPTIFDLLDCMQSINIPLPASIHELLFEVCTLILRGITSDKTMQPNEIIEKYREIQHKQLNATTESTNCNSHLEKIKYCCNCVHAILKLIIDLIRRGMPIATIKTEIQKKMSGGEKNGDKASKFGWNIIKPSIDKVFHLLQQMIDDSMKILLLDILRADTKIEHYEIVLQQSLHLSALVDAIFIFEKAIPNVENAVLDSKEEEEGEDWSSQLEKIPVVAIDDPSNVDIDDPSSEANDEPISEANDIENIIRAQLDEKSNDWDQQKWKKHVSDAKSLRFETRAKSFVCDGQIRVDAILGPNCDNLIASFSKDEFYNANTICYIFPLMKDAQKEAQNEAQKIADVHNATSWMTCVCQTALRNDLKSYLLAVALTKNSVIAFPEVNINEKAQLNGLLQCCPIEHVKIILNPMLVSDTELSRLCLRKDGKYGIRFAEYKQYSKLQELGVTTKYVDLTSEYNTSSSSSSSMFLKIVDPIIKQECCFVVIKGLKHVDDTLLKWCAEFTCQRPCCWLIFDCDSTIFNLPENVDRVVKQTSTHGESFDSLSVKLLRKTFKSMKKDLPNYLTDLSPNKTSKSATWSDELPEIINTGKWVIVSGAPGIGKTYFLENFMKNNTDKFRNKMRIDGSSDIFVRQSISDVLSQVIARSMGEMTLLFLDEFHMMTMEQKGDLIKWSNDNSSTVFTVMASNRLDQADYNLFKEILEHSGSNYIDPNKPAESNIIEARGSMKTIIEKQIEPIVTELELARSKSRILLFIFIWVRSTRNLFGEEMMTMRPIKGIVTRFGESLRDNRLLKALKFELSNCLINKFATLSNSFCHQFVDEIWKLYSNMAAKVEEGSSITDIQRILANYIQTEMTKLLSSPNMNLSNMLVVVSLLDVTMNNDCMSFPEFAENYISYHPFERISLWACYMHKFQCNEKLHAASILQDLFDKVSDILINSASVIDMPMKFPRIMSGGGSNIQSCDCICSTCAPSNTLGIIASLQRGYVIDTEEVLKYWSHHPITDVALFERLMSVWSHLLVTMTEDGPFSSKMANHLRTLIKLSPSTELSESCVAQLNEPIDMADITSPLCIYLIAKWKIFRYSTVQSMDTEINDSTTKMIIWASQNSFNSLDVFSEPEERTIILRDMINKTLIDLSNRFKEKKLITAESSKEYEYFSFICCNQFESLIQLDKDVSPIAWMLLCKNTYPPKESWPSPIKSLSRVLHHGANSQQAHQVFEHFWSGIMEDGPREYQLLLSDSILYIDECLHAEDQCKFLKTPTVDTNNNKLFVGIIVERFSEGLQKLTAEEILIQAGELKSALLQAQQRIQGKVFV